MLTIINNKSFSMRIKSSNHMSASDTALGHKFPVYFFFLAVALAIVSCSPMEEEEQEGNTREQPSAKAADEVRLTSQQVKQAGIEIGGFDQRTMNTEIKANGVVDIPPQNMASVSAHMGGFVKYTELLPGDKVKKGQTLAILEHPSYITLQQEYLQALSRLGYLQKDLERQTELEKENVGAKRKLQQAESDYAITKAQVQGLKAQLQMIGISIPSLEKGTIARTVSLPSPISGYVKSVHVNIGKYVNPTDVLFEIVNKEHMHIELQVFEKDAAKVKEGQLIKFTVPQAGAEEMAAKIYLVGKVFEGESKSINVHGHMEPEREDLLPGAYITARIITEQQAIAALPEEAVVSQGDSSYIFVEKVNSSGNHTFQRVPVRIGVAEGGSIAASPIIPLADSMHIVKKGTYYLQAALKNTEE
ncbi:efflux RND transporter periplasmic adaptor subunit [Rhodocytophaga aerolata]|uniref:Efflux RND transporter periplasmic adaptor subunit n=1 Tax=Rhodocytophaga aerolata TaxID=455078 RepID=A0ABT8RD60_9BACT|nr:efflux RND transporter periplasmic adaptor subunit [Rhodocytophaga aerolata]MDO1450020.1 efflux RND transporter periplasmic adaptor subunit [Rhodocytophaga aerolata]